MDQDAQRVGETVNAGKKGRGVRTEAETGVRIKKPATRRKKRYGSVRERWEALKARRKARQTPLYAAQSAQDPS
jgi:hypothetical protein